MIHWEQVVSSMLDPSLQGWQRLGRLSPRPMQLQRRLQASELGKSWRFASKRGTLLARRIASVPEQCPPLDESSSGDT
jgi:hypothetical protein